LRSTGKIILVPKSLILHKEAAERGNLTKGLFGREIPVVPYDKLWLRYYGVRNSIWLRRKEMGRARLFIFMVRATPYRSQPR